MDKNQFRGSHSSDSLLILPLIVTAVILGCIVQLFLFKFNYLSLLFFIIPISILWHTFKSLLNIPNILILSFLFGSTWTHLHSPSNQHNHITSLYKNGDKVIGIVTSETTPTKSGNQKLIISSSSLLSAGDKISCIGNIIVYAPENLKIEYGDTLILSKLSPILEPKNPGEFDLKKYYTFRNIHYQSSLYYSSFLLISSNSNHLIKKSISIRNFLLEHLDNFIKSEEAFATLSALLFGQKKLLTKEISNHFSSAGAMHILAVSGLHLGIVLGMIQLLLSFTIKKRFPIIQLGIKIILLWSYAFLTGFSPSITRAALMFSAYLIGSYSHREHSIYGALSIAALIMIIHNPYVITEVGFQLSFLAVLGIIRFSPALLALYSPTNFFLNQAWQITCISISAQLATFPLGLLYFHQFPNYFLVSNFFVIPIAFIIIYLAVFSYLIGFIPIIQNFSFYLLETTTTWLNQFTALISSTPYAVLKGIHISVLETWLLYALVTFLFSGLILKKLQAIKLALIIAILIFLSNISNRLAIDHQLIVYDAKKDVAIDIIANNHHLYIADSTLLHSSPSRAFLIEHHWNELFLDSITTINPLNPISVYSILNKKILHISHPTKSYCNEQFDEIIVSHNAMTLEKIITQFKFKKVIFDGSNSNDFLTCLRHSPHLSNHIHIVPDSGIYITNF